MSTGFRIATVKTGGSSFARRRAVDVVKQILEAAHTLEVIHRDVKPANVMVQRGVGSRSQTLRVKVLDFGAGKDLGDTDATLRTEHGVVLRTLSYMSPEQLTMPAEIDCRSDIYAVAVLLYHALAGKMLFSVTTVQEALAHILRGPDPDLPPRPDVPTALVDVVMKGMHKDRGHRFASAGDMLHALDDIEWRSGGGVGRNRWRLAQCGGLETPCIRAADRSRRRRVRPPRRGHGGSISSVAMGRDRGRRTGGGARVWAGTHRLDPHHLPFGPHTCG